MPVPPYHVLVASGAFKDVYSPMEACRVIAAAVRRVAGDGADVRVTEVPLADGGEWSAEILLARTGSKRVDVSGVVDPRGVPVDSFYVEVEGGTTFIASSSILGLSPDLDAAKNPLNLTSYGLGQLIRNAANRSPKRIVVGLGGTNTVDGGIGMAQALGAEFLDHEGRSLVPRGEYLVAADLPRVAALRLDRRRRSGDSADTAIDGVSLTALCDASVHPGQMDTPTGHKISALFDSQKAEIIGSLNAGIRRYCQLLDQAETVRTRNPWISGELSVEPFFGVAGGLLLSLVALFEVEARLGVDYLFEFFDVEREIGNSDLVVTGEGKFDNSLWGKTPIGVTRLSAKVGKPAVVLCGDIEPELKKHFRSYVSDSLPPEFEENGIDAVISCHRDYDRMELPRPYEERLQYFRERNPAIFADALAEYIGEKVRLLTSA